MWQGSPPLVSYNYSWLAIGKTVLFHSYSRGPRCVCVHAGVLLSRGRHLAPGCETDGQVRVAGRPEGRSAVAAVTAAAAAPTLATRRAQRAVYHGGRHARADGVLRWAGGFT